MTELWSQLRLLNEDYLYNDGKITQLFYLAGNSPTDKYFFGNSSGRDSTVRMVKRWWPQQYRVFSLFCMCYKHWIKWYWIQRKRKQLWFGLSEVFCFFPFSVSTTEASTSSYFFTFVFPVWNLLPYCNISVKGNNGLLFFIFLFEPLLTSCSQCLSVVCPDPGG